MNSKIQSESAMTDTGEMRVGFRLTPEQQASLELLHDSPHWAVYREVLLAAKTEFFNGVLPIDDPHKVMKQVGMVTGVNFAINQLPVLVAEMRRQRQKAVDEAEKVKAPFKRG